MSLTWQKHIQAKLSSRRQQLVGRTALLKCSNMRRFKEEAEGSTTDLKEQLAAAHQERHTVEEQAKQQVLPTVDCTCMALHILKGSSLCPYPTPPAFPPWRPSICLLCAQLAALA